MKLTTKGKFAITALLDIAMYSNVNNTPTTLYDVSVRQGISLSYLEQIFVKLRRHGMVTSYKGPGGGYTLAKTAETTRLSDIIKAVNDDMDARSCHGLQNCKDNQKCLTHDLWNDLTTHMYNYLDNITLQHIINKDNNSNEIIFHKKNNVQSATIAYI